MKKKIISLLVLLTVLFSSISINTSDAYAADGTVKIFLGDSDTPRHHKAIKEGELSEELSFELNEGTVKSSNFTSGNTALFQIVKENGKTYVKAIKEGTGYVTLTVVNNSDKVFKERLFISVYKDVEKCMGIINKVTDGYRGASDNADVEKEDAKGTITKNTKVDILASCGDYYLIQTRDGRVFEDDLDTAFVKKNALEIPVTDIKIVNKTLNIEASKKRKVKILFKPSLTTEKIFTWKVQDSSIATVDNKGVITAKTPGKTMVSISTKLGASASIGLKVKELKPKKHKWVKLKDVNNTSDSYMQGMTGYKNNIYFLKIKKTGKGIKGKTKYAVLYTAKIKNKGKKIGHIKKLRKYDSSVGHANGMTAVYNKKSKKVVLYIAPSDEQKGKIAKISIKYDTKKKKYKASKIKLINCYGDNMGGKSYNAISCWKYNNENYFIIRSKIYNYVCKEEKNVMTQKYTFKLPNSYAPNDKNKTRGQGTACAIKDSIYYCVNSFAFGKDYKDKKKYGKISYVFCYKLSIDNNSLDVNAVKTYELKATNQVKKQKGKTNIKRFEMEGLYIYGNKAILNSEGSPKCFDLIGKFDIK